MTFDAAAGGVTAELLRRLVEIVGPANVITDADQRSPYEVDWTGRFRGHTPAVVRPGSTAEVAAVVDACRADRVPLVLQGGNTGLVGGGVPLAGELVLSLRRLTTIGPVDLAARQITVGAGVVISDLRDVADRAGLAYAIDFGARDSATVGGTIATNAGGLNLIRHGGTREQLIGVEAVLADGSVVSRLQGLVKDNTGYHLPSLLCGSEGTLGIVTAARLRLIPRHEHRATALIGLHTVDEAIAIVADLRARLDSLEAAELMLADGVGLVSEAFGIPPPFATPAPVLLLVEAADHHDPTGELGDIIGAATGVVDVAVATDAHRRSALWRYRDEHTLAINTLGPPHKLDVTLPIDRLAEFVATVPALVREVAPAARVWLFGHIGDGNIHVNITGLDVDDEGADEAVIGEVIAMDGSISAEHGIGTAKAAWLVLDRSAAEIAAMRSIKDAFDPLGILNPNVLFG